MIDSQLVLQASVTKTATFNGTGIDWATGNSPRPLFARVIYSAATNASGSNAFTFTIDHSDDNSTFYLHTSGAADVITLSTTAQTGEIYIPILTKKRYIRLTITQVGAGSTPTITYNAYVSPGFKS